MSDIECVWTEEDLYNALCDGFRWNEADKIASYLAKCTRLMAAFKEVDSATCDCMSTTGCPEYCVKCDWSIEGGIYDQLKTAIEGKTDE